MNSRIYRPIIIKTLNQANTHKPKSLEELADRIVDNMEVFDEMLTLAGGGQAIIAQPQSQASLPPQLTMQVPPAFDMSSRIIPKEEDTSLLYSEEEMQTKRMEAINFYKAHLPQRISVQPPNFDTPIPVDFRGCVNSRGAMPFVSLQWAAAGSAAGLIIQIDATKRLLTVDEVLKQVKEQASMVYFSSPKVVSTIRPMGGSQHFSTGASWAGDETPMINGH